MVHRENFEISTYRLKGDYSASELTVHLVGRLGYDPRSCELKARCIFHLC